MAKKKKVVMVSSSVYGIEELLDQIYKLLTANDFEVLMSHKGTVPVFSNLTAFECCLDAVECCDIFIGIIRPQYGSGRESNGISITHNEIREAIKLDKQRHYFVHSSVVNAKKLLADIGYESPGKRKRLPPKKKAGAIDNLNIVQMYEEAIGEIDADGNKLPPNPDSNYLGKTEFERYEDVDRLLMRTLSNCS